MLTVQCLGLIYFHVCDGRDKLALLPNGTDAGSNIDVHRGSIFVHPEEVESEDWWEGSRYEHQLKVVGDDGNDIEVPVLEFRFPEPVEITLGGTGKSLDLGNLKASLHKMKDSDPDFKVDPADVNAIAKIPITQGELTVYGFDTAAAVQWKIDTSGSITVSAQGARETKALTLKESTGPRGTEIVLSNTSDMIDPPAQHKPGDHFRLYAELNKSRKADKLEPPTGPPKGLDPLPFGHRYLASLVYEDQIPGTNCAPTCC